jgi:hypothetical protein
MGSAVLVVGLAGPAAADVPPMNSTYTLTLDKTRNDDATPAAGAQFTAILVNNADGSALNVTTNDGLAAASAILNAGPVGVNTDGNDVVYSYGTGATPLPATAGGPYLTTSDGKANFGALPIGVYLIHENVTPAGASPAADFLVMLPQARVNDNGTPGTGAAAADDFVDGWTDLEVNVKNLFAGAIKFGDFSGSSAAPKFQIGQDIIWNVLTTVPARPLGTDPQTYALTQFSIVDQINTTYLTLRGAVTVTASNDNGDPVTLTEGAGNDYTLDTTGQLVTITFLESGLAQLRAAAFQPGGLVTVRFNTTVKAVPEDGVIKNTAQISSNTSTDEPPPEPVEVDAEGEVYFGGITIDKQDANDENTPVEGAKFEVMAIRGLTPAFCNVTNANNPNAGFMAYVTWLPGVDLAAFGAGASAANEGDRIVWTTDATGKVEISGLRFSGNNGVTDSLTSGDFDYVNYCLVEVATNPDYNLLAAPIAFTVTGTAGDVTVVVKNTMKNTPGFNLPLTGGSGLALVVTVGVGLGGTVLLLIGLRRVRERRAEGVASL